MGGSPLGVVPDVVGTVPVAIVVAAVFVTGLVVAGLVVAELVVATLVRLVGVVAGEHCRPRLGFVRTSGTVSGLSENTARGPRPARSRQPYNHQRRSLPPR